MKHPETCLVCLTHKPTARLENWSWKPGDDIVWGNVYGDIHGRFKDGSVIHTSLIRDIDIENGHVFTLNSLYVLGERRQPLTHN